jgi:predicted nuclease of predicted toxin-antitoxin system
MRFLADMGVSLGVVAWLREKGFDTVHLREEGLKTLPDDQVFRKAISEGRAVLTFDLDFGEIAALCGGEGAGVILFRLKNTRTPHVIERLAVALNLLDTEFQQGAVVTVEDSRIRIRRLPL